MVEATQFRLELDQAYQKKVVERLEQQVRAVAFIVDAQLVDNTPVDTGRARANWLPSLNIPALFSSSSLSPPGAAGVAQTVQSYSIEDTVFITNNLVYIKPLNEGHSAQAPAGFVEAAIQVGKDAIR